MSKKPKSATQPKPSGPIDKVSPTIGPEKQFPKAPDRSWLGYLALAGLLAVSIWLIQKADDTKPADWNESRLSYLPSGKIIKPMAMDLDEGLADLFLVQGMVYFADAFMTGKTYEWMNTILDIATTLNPHIRQAYEFSGVVLTKHKSEIPKTLLLLDRGIKTFPKDWRIRLYAALAQINLDSNFVKAAEYLKPIVLEEGVPSHIRTLCASFLNEGGGQRVALAFLVDCYIRTDNPINQEIFLEKILKLYPMTPWVTSYRTETLKKILHEIRSEPSIVLMGLGIMHQYLLGGMSPETKRIMELLED